MAVASHPELQPSAPPHVSVRSVRAEFWRRSAAVLGLLAAMVAAPGCAATTTTSRAEQVATPAALSGSPSATGLPAPGRPAGESFAGEDTGRADLPWQIPLIPFGVVASHPHDSQAWTQGLAYAGVDRLYEGTGDYENSSLREVALATGEVLGSVSLPRASMYGEGITVFGDSLLQLTWRDGVGLVYRARDFAPLGQFRYPAAGTDAPREGWGITTDGVRLFVSDGSHSVYVADAQRTLADGELRVTDVLTVAWQGQPITGLNELEYVDGAIYANVWQTDTIVRFDAANGEVNGRLDLADLLTAEERVTADIANGVAYDPSTGELLVTGKKWPRLFVLRLG